MLALTGSRRTFARAVTIALALVTITLLAALAPSGARASGCENSWTNNKGGSWSTASNWSKKAVPVAGEEVCIGEAGTYTVEMNGLVVSLKTLTVGGASGTQTLSVASTCSVNASLTTTSGLTVGTAGALTMTNSDGCGNNVTLVGPISNSGTVTSEKVHGGNRTIQGNLTNTGTLQVNANTAFSGTEALLLNEGALDLATEVALTVSAKGSVTNGAGGKVVAVGSGDVLAGTGTSFKQGAGTTSGTLPVIVDDASLTYEGSGEGTIAVRGESSLAGSSSAGQVLLVQSTCGENAKVTASGGFANGGQVTFTNGDGCGNNTTFVGAISNSGTVSSEKANGGARSIQGSFANGGALNVNGNTTYNGTATTLTNTGTLSVAEGVQLTVTAENTVSNGAGGNIATGATGQVFLNKGAAFKEGAGTTTGTAPVVVDDGALTYEGTGESTVLVRGEGTIAGSIGTKQSLVVESSCGENAREATGTSYTNAGSIVMTNFEGCGNNAAIAVTGGATLTNSGTITTEPAHGGRREIEGNLTNTGTLAIDANTGYEAGAAALTNEGSLAIATGVTFAVAGGATVSNNAGTISGGTTGVLSETKGTFNQGAGKTSGTQPVVLDNTALHYTGKGAGVLALRGEGGSVSGAINAGQTLSIQSTCSENTAPTATAFTNSGTIVLTNGDGCGDSSSLRLGAETLTNKGTIKIEEPHGGTRAIEGSVKQEKTLQLGPGNPTLKVSGTFTQSKSGTLKDYVNSSSSFGVLASAGAATLAGKLQLVQLKGFFASVGQKYAVLTTPALAGTFSKESGAVVKQKGVSGRYYLPTYAAGGVTLVVTQSAEVFAPPAEAAPGTIVTITGTSFAPADTIKLAFTDAKKVKTTFANATTNGSGEFKAEVELPAGAALGSGKFTVTSTVIAGLLVNTGYKVT